MRVSIVGQNQDRRLAIAREIARGGEDKVVIVLVGVGQKFVVHPEKSFCASRKNRFPEMASSGSGLHKR